MKKTERQLEHAAEFSNERADYYREEPEPVICAHCCNECEDNEYIIHRYKGIHGIILKEIVCTDCQPALEQSLIDYPPKQ